MSMLFMDEETGRPSIGGIFAVYFLPIVIVIAYWFMYGSYFNNNRDYAGEAAQLQAKNERTKQRMRDWLKKHPSYVRKARKWE